MENSTTDLQDRIDQLEAILNNIAEGVLVTDPRGHIIYYNQAAEKMLGPIPGNQSFKSWPKKFGFFLDDERTYFPADKMPSVRALAKDTALPEEMILHPAGSQEGTWITMDAQPLNNNNGEIIGVITVFRDINQRKRIELTREKFIRRNEVLFNISQSLAEAGNDLRQVFNLVATQAAEYIGDGSIVTFFNSKTDDIRIVAVHHTEPAARASLREFMLSEEYETKDSIIGGVIKTGESLLIPAIRSEQLEMITTPDFAKCFKKIGVQSLLIVPIKGRNGIFGALELLRDTGGEAYSANDQSFLLDIAYRAGLAIENSLLVNSLVSEITERELVEKALEQSQVRFRSIFESTTLGIKVLDSEGLILQTNPAFQEMIGYSAQDLLNLQITKLLHPADAVKMVQSLEILKNGKKRDIRLEHRILHKDGSIIWVNATFTGVNIHSQSEESAFFVGITENITERKRMEGEIADMKKRLQSNLEAERLRIAQELHDGPMQDLYSAIYQLEGVNKEVSSIDQGILESVKLDIQKVVQDLRSTATELRPPTLANFGLEKAIRSHVGDFQSKYPQINVHLALAQDRQLLPEALRLVLYRIYQHSMTNVARHSQATEVHVRFTFDAEETRLSITDNGIGFSVPNNWFKLTRQGHYGLAGVAERVDMLGGSFLVDSTPGKGTSIHVSIPIHETSEQIEPD